MRELSELEMKRIYAASTARKPSILDEALGLHTLLAVVHSPECSLLLEQGKEEVVLTRARKSFAKAEKKLRVLIRQEIRTNKEMSKISKKMVRDWEARQEQSFGKGWRKILRQMRNKPV